MPIYEFTCRACGHDFETLVPRPGAKAPCPECGSAKVAQRISRPGGFSVKSASGPTCPMTGGPKNGGCGHCPAH
ncbi:MAG: zinc ribbon domain-containing protein [Planctomycetes bacterium]|jgi:putative FmdB family regulatory protein|nr:zinc ribbon domain-containing protein [Planctomycetota bacterium]